MPGQGPLGHGDELGRRRVDVAHPGGEGGIAVPAVDDGPDVDRHHVAVAQRHVVGDAVDHDVVG